MQLLHHKMPMMGFISQIFTIILLLQFVNCIFTNFNFSFLQKWEYSMKKINKKAFVTKTKRNKTINNHNGNKKN